MTSPANERNQHIIAEFRANHGQVGGYFAAAPLLLLHTAGARSGQPRTIPAISLIRRDAPAPEAGG